MLERFCESLNIYVFFIASIVFFIVMLIVSKKSIKKTNKLCSENKIAAVSAIEDGKFFSLDLVLLIGVFFFSSFLNWVFVYIKLSKVQTIQTGLFFSLIVSMVCFIVLYIFYYHEKESLWQGIVSFLAEILFGIGVSIVLLALLTFVSDGWIVGYDVIVDNFKSLIEQNESLKESDYGKELSKSLQEFRLALLAYAGGIGILAISASISFKYHEVHWVVQLKVKKLKKQKSEEN